MKPRPAYLLRFTAFVVCFLPAEASRELVFVQAIWRHGDRAPLSLPYPRDPYTESAWQRGWQQLTNIGMNQLNELGKYFRTRYNSFLPSHFIPSQVYIRSSDSDRALTSAQAFLSGFYPAEGSFQWEKGNSWQPIPVHAATPGDPDLLLKPASTYCKNYDTLVDSDDKKQADVYNVKNADLFKLLGEQTGIKNFSYVNVNKIYDVNRELIHNMTERQPAWVFQKWPEYNGSGTMDIITELRRIRMMTRFNSPQKSKLVGGYLLNNWVQNAQKVANGSMDVPQKMLLLSSHDTALLALMYAMNVANDLMVPYGSALIMEIYKDNNDYMVELLYRNDTTRVPYTLQIPECGNPCTVQKMAEQYPNMVLSSLSEQQKLCGTPLKECNGSSAAVYFFLCLFISTAINFL
ncbi:hypothetical protein RB195_003793 [Necator americanus]|uniref:Histidine acid phosphatase n=1 Tax=Necator americanus TaxID=51031 RepID=A0ABR1DQY3_NECAM